MQRLTVNANTRRSRPARISANERDFSISTLSPLFFQEARQRIAWNFVYDSVLSAPDCPKWVLKSSEVAIHGYHSFAPLFLDLKYNIPNVVITLNKSDPNYQIMQTKPFLATYFEDGCQYVLHQCAPFTFSGSSTLKSLEPWALLTSSTLSPLFLVTKEAFVTSQMGPDHSLVIAVEHVPGAQDVRGALTFDQDQNEFEDELLVKSWAVQLLLGFFDAHKLKLALNIPLCENVFFTSGRSRYVSIALILDRSWN